MPTDVLFELLKPVRMTHVVDIGANSIDGDPPYKSLMAAGHCRVTGFEPQSDALAALNAKKGASETYLPYAVGDGTVASLHVCRASGMTSLFKPDKAVLRYFAKFLEWGEVVREDQVVIHRLDDIEQVADIDLLKIDVQGSELSVFRSGREKLRNAVVVHSEVSFVGLYENQPMFADQDIELRAQGFVFHTFASINRRMVAPLNDPNSPYAAFKQIIEADAVYVRDFKNPDAMTDEQLKHLALIMHHCYGSFDIAANCLHHLSARQAVAPEAMDRYVSHLMAR